jgi:sortase A
MRKLSYGLMLLGLLIIAAPRWMEWRADLEQSRLLQEAERLVAETEPAVDADAIAGYQRLSRLLEEASASADDPAAVGEAAPAGEADSALPLQTAEPAPMVQESASIAKDGKKPIATIEIPAIGVKLPVLEGATLENMKSAAAHMSETTPLGQVGNAAIAAHRARTKGRLFNRLDEVKVGDEIVIRTAGERYVYNVYRVTIVEPTDVSVLNKNGDERIVTLITCDPVVNATHRLIVQAKLEPAAS